MWGRTLIMEFRKSWRGFTIFILVVVIISAGMAQLFPVISEAFEEEMEELEGMEYVHLEIEDEIIHLSWVEVEDAVEYVVVEDRHPYMMMSREVNKTEMNRTTIPHPEDEVRYFAVKYLTNDSAEVPLGMASTVEPTDPMEELMDTAFYRMFTAGRADVTFQEMEGFMSVELYSWWILLVGVYLSYLSVKSITEDYEERRMDVIFSTPIPRKQYILEKFSALALFTLILVSLSGSMLMLSVRAVGEPGGWEFLVSLLISWPMLMVIIAFSMLFAVVTQSSRKAVGGSFAVILIQYALFMAGHMVESLEPVLPFTISYYWDYNSVLLDGVVYPWQILLLLGLVVAAFAATLKVFQNSDIPS